MNKFEWTPEGRQLLSIFESKIKFYGGSDQLIEYLCQEDLIIEYKNYTPPKKHTKFQALKAHHKSYILNNWGKQSTKSIAQSIKISHDTVTSAAKQMKLGRNKYSHTYIYGQKNKITGWLLNLETGIYYENLTRAAESINVDRQKLYFKMNKRKINNSSFIKV